jgi:hypothetical protein
LSFFDRDCLGGEWWANDNDPVILAFDPGPEIASPDFVSISVAA